jgi:predicted RNase H-like nuclease (RuvC/YqgF family)
MGEGENNGSEKHGISAKRGVAIALIAGLPAIITSSAGILEQLNNREKVRAQIAVQSVTLDQSWQQLKQAVESQQTESKICRDRTVEMSTKIEYLQARLEQVESRSRVTPPPEPVKVDRGTAANRVMTMELPDEPPRPAENDPKVQRQVEQLKKAF